MNWQEYNYQRRNNPKMPALEDVVLDVLRAQDAYVKREDLCSLVAGRTGIYLVDVMGNLSTTLKHLKDAGKIKSPVRGYWRVS